MKLKFLGGVATVTGSLYLLEVGDVILSIDCGMEQEDIFEGNGFNDFLEVYERKISRMPVVDYLILTHAHLDHSGLVPLAFKKKKIGKRFSSEPVISTGPTKELSFYLFQDTLKIMKEKAPFTEEDVENLLYVWRTKDSVSAYGRRRKVVEEEIADGVYLTLFDSSHIIGSVSVFLRTAEGNILFSGDIGTKIQQLVDYPPQLPGKNEVHYLVIESTYGGTVRKNVESEKERFIEAVEDVLKKGGKVLIPVFAIGRLQEVLYTLNQAGITRKHKVYVDTPLGEKVMNVYMNHIFDLSRRVQRLARVCVEGGNIFGDYERVTTHSKSLELAERNEPCVILSASGMLNGGRSVNHFRVIRNDPKSAIFFVGYQVKGTVGRRVLDGEESVMCRVDNFSAFSAHADQEELLEYVDRVSGSLRKVFVVHGEKESREELARKIRENFGVEVILPIGDSDFGGMEGNIGRSVEREEEYEVERVLQSKAVYVRNVKWTVFEEENLKIALVCMVDKGTHFEALPSSEYLNYLKRVQENKFREIYEAEGIVRDEVEVVSFCEDEGIEEVIEEMSEEELVKNLKHLREVGVLTNSFAREFYRELVFHGEKAARNRVKEKHTLNPNTGKRRWEKPKVDDVDAEKIYELAYRVFMNLTRYDPEKVRILLQIAGAKPVC